MENTIEIYYRSGNAALHAGELEQYRASYRENIRTARVIDAALDARFDGMHLDHAALDDVMQQADPDRVALVLANTLQWRAFDGRFSQASRTWAQEIRMPDSAPDRSADTSCFWACQTHSTVLEGFIGLFRRQYSQQ